MFWTMTGVLTASWLLFMPALWPEQVASSWLAAAVGLVALPLTVLGVVSPAMRRKVGWLGLLLGVGNFFFLDGSMGVIASYAVSGILLVGAGAAPTAPAGARSATDRRRGARGGRRAGADRWRPERSGELEHRPHGRILQLALQLEPQLAADGLHRGVAGGDLPEDAGDALGPADLDQLPQQQRPQPLPLVGVGHQQGELRLSGPGAGQPARPPGCPRGASPPAAAGRSTTRAISRA